MHYLKHHEVPNPYDIMVIPSRLLALANQDVPSVRKYRLEHPPTNPLKPEDPTLEAFLLLGERVRVLLSPKISLKSPRGN